MIKGLKFLFFKRVLIAMMLKSHVLHGFFLSMKPSLQIQRYYVADPIKTWLYITLVVWIGHLREVWRSLYSVRRFALDWYSTGWIAGMYKNNHS